MFQIKLIRGFQKLSTILNFKKNTKIIYKFILNIKLFQSHNLMIFAF